MGAPKQYQLAWAGFEALDDELFNSLDSDEELAVFRLIREQAKILHRQYLDAPSERVEPLTQVLQELQIGYAALVREVARVRRRQEKAWAELRGDLDAKKHRRKQSLM